jgi:hypothetical protein
MQQMGKLGGQSMLDFSSIKRKIKLRVDESWTNNKVQHAISISKSLLILNFFHSVWKHTQSIRTMM